MKIINVIMIAVVCIALYSSQVLAWTVSVTEAWDGGYVATLIHSTDPTKNEKVGKFETKKEARKAGRKAKKAKESGFKAEESGPCSDPMARC